MEIQVVELPYRIKKQQQVLSGKISEETCGGSFVSPNFLKNETFVLEVYERTDIEIKFEGTRDCFAMVYLVEKDDHDESLYDVTYEKFMNSTNAGFYYQGISYVSTKLDRGSYYILNSIQNTVAGTYTLTVSALSYRLTEEPNLVVPEFEPDTKTQTEYFGITKYNLASDPAMQKFNHTQSLFGSWTPTSSYGTHRATIDCYQIFMKNPGYIIRPPSDSLVRLHLVS